jgi:hypothetical protein
LTTLKLTSASSKREADFTERLVNVLLGQGGLAAESFEGALEFFLEILEHKS